MKYDNKGDAAALLGVFVTICVAAAWFGYSVLGPAMLHPVKGYPE